MCITKTKSNGREDEGKSRLLQIEPCVVWRHLKNDNDDPAIQNTGLVRIKTTSNINEGD